MQRGGVLLLLLLCFTLWAAPLLVDCRAHSQQPDAAEVEAEAQAVTVPCARSFADAFFSLGPWQGPKRAFVQRCPTDCLNPAQHNITGAVVMGSFPYHPSSSLCLSAIHAGVINGTLGRRGVGQPVLEPAVERVGGGHLPARS